MSVLGETAGRTTRTPPQRTEPVGQWCVSVACHEHAAGCGNGVHLNAAHPHPHRDPMRETIGGRLEPGKGIRRQGRPHRTAVGSGHMRKGGLLWPVPCSSGTRDGVPHSPVRGALHGSRGLGAGRSGGRPAEGADLAARHGAHHHPPGLAGPGAAVGDAPVVGQGGDEEETAAGLGLDTGGRPGPHRGAVRGRSSPAPLPTVPTALPPSPRFPCSRLVSRAAARRATGNPSTSVGSGASLGSSASGSEGRLGP